MTFNALSGVLGIPAVAAALFAALPDYRVAARSNIAAAGLTLLCSLSLFFVKPQPGAYLPVDDLNGTFIVLTSFVGFTSPLMVTLGLVSLVFAAFMLYRRRDIKRMFAYSSIEHMGIITFAFGMGGPLANFAGIL